MKAIFHKDDFIDHRKVLRTFKINKKIANKAKVTLEVSNKLKVNAHGFIRDIECVPIESGSIVMPYLLWIKVIEIIIDSAETDIAFAAENGWIQLGKVEISSPTIELK